METRSKTQKRQRLMVSSYYVLPQRPDLPARFESLNDDVLTIVLEFVGNKSYAIYAGINKHCKEIYLNTKEMTKETFLFGYGSLAVIKDRVNVRMERAIEEEDEDYNNTLFYPVGKGVVLYNRRDILAWALQERKNDVLKGICFVAAREGRFDLLNEVWENVEDWDDKEEKIFQSVDFCAAIYGKLKLLKWLDGKGLKIDKYWCAKTAAYRGHLHILLWLQEEQGLELHVENLYMYAINGKHLHVLKWLREEKVDWGEYNFTYAVEAGNLDIIQWLHNRGCPWDQDIRVNEEDLKPEVVEWCRANGYGDRLSVPNIL